MKYSGPQQIPTASKLALQPEDICLELARTDEELQSVRSSNSKGHPKNYSCERKQFVSIYEFSIEMPVTCGIPQGFIIEALICIIYINDIINVSPIVFPNLIS